MYSDDNFGAWTGTEDAEVRAFYRTTQKRSVAKVCQGCHRTVKILPHYAYCNNCADVMERGGEF